MILFFQITFFQIFKQNTKEIDTRRANNTTTTSNYFWAAFKNNMFIASQKCRTFNNKMVKPTIILFILSTNIIAAWSRGFAGLPLKTTGDSVHIDTDVDFKPGKCVPVPFNQTVTKRGCVSVKIRNNLCYGACGSMYIPLGNPMQNSTKRETFFDCRHCMPSKYQLIRIPMYCPERRRKHRTKRVLLIHECDCSSRACYFHSWKKRWDYFVRNVKFKVEQRNL